MKKNLYAFGDSFCKYAWPMWPDLIGQCYENLHNHGLPGCGNFYIFYKSMIELNSVQLTEDDTVIIQWSEPLRHDFIDEENYWSGLGIGSAELFLKHKVEYLNNENTAVLKHLTYMLAMAEFLSTKKCQWFFMFLTDNAISHLTKLDVVDNLNNEYNSLKNNILKYKDNIVDKVSMTASLEQDKSPIALSMCGGNVFHDGHPTPKYTYSYIEKCLANRLDLNLKKIKRYRNQSEDLIKKCKVQHKNKLVYDFDLLNEVF